MSLFDDLFKTVSEFGKKSSEPKTPKESPFVVGSPKEIKHERATQNIQDSKKRVQELTEMLDGSNFHFILFAVQKGEDSEMMLSANANNKKVITSLFAAAKSSKEFRSCILQTAQLIELAGDSIVIEKKDYSD